MSYLKSLSKLALASLLLSASVQGFSAPAELLKPTQVPDTLKSWVDWVAPTARELRCPTSAETGATTCTQSRGLLRVCRISLLKA